MAGNLLRICSLWAKDGANGTTISGRLADDARRALLNQLQSGHDTYRLVIFQNQRRRSDSDCTHSIHLSYEGDGRGKAADSPQEPRTAAGAVGHGREGERAQAWRGEPGTRPQSANEREPDLEDDSAPF